MSLSGSFFGSLVAEFLKDILFKRPISVEVKRDASGNTQFKASINPSGQQPQFVWGPPAPYPYPPPYAYGYQSWNQQQERRDGAPSQPSDRPADRPSAPENRARPFILSEEFRS